MGDEWERGTGVTGRAKRAGVGKLQPCVGASPPPVPLAQLEVAATPVAAGRRPAAHRLEHAARYPGPDPSPAAAATAAALPPPLLLSAGKPGSATPAWYDKLGPDVGRCQPSTQVLIDKTVCTVEAGARAGADGELLRERLPTGRRSRVEPRAGSGNGGSSVLAAVGGRPTAII
eukprot:scaffold534_cov102-Isochrysis_galbana.AAC.4